MPKVQRNAKPQGLNSSLLGDPPQVAAHHDIENVIALSILSVVCVSDDCWGDERAEFSASCL